MARTRWTLQWKNWVAATKRPGVWLRKEGGCLVRARVTDVATGKLTEIKKVLPQADEETAVKWLESEKAKLRAGLSSANLPKQRFAEFAASLFEKKVKLGKIRSRAGRDKWHYTLAHLIGGSSSDDGVLVVAGFGDTFIDQIGREQVEIWQMGVNQLIRAGQYSPVTTNGWLSILRVVMKAAKRELGLRHLATEDIEPFDTSEHQPYSEANPNSLAPEQVPAFSACLRKEYPQHFAMFFLGLATGLRPSSLRPLRRTGESADVLWKENRILVRRSQTLGEEVMATTKQKKRYSITLPDKVMEVLRWHVETQLDTPEQKESELLFPSVTGGYRSPGVLNKPFADVSDAIGLGFTLTQRGLRRTFNDLARAAKVEDLVTRSISGHLTERMQHHYSTVRGTEQREGIARVINLLEVRQALATGNVTDVPSANTDNTDENGAPTVPSSVPGGAPSGAPCRASGAPSE